MKPRPKILVINSTSIVSGAEIVLHQLMRQLDDYEVFLCVGDSPQARALFSDIENVYFSPLFNNLGMLVGKGNKIFLIVRKIINLILSMIWLRKTYRTIKPDFIMGNTIFDSLYVMLFRNKFAVCFVHDVVERGTLRSIYARLFLKQISGVVCVSHSAAEALEQTGIKSTVVHNGVPGATASASLIGQQKKSFYSGARDHLVLGFIGSWSDRKRPEVFVRLVRELGKDLKVKGLIIVNYVSPEYASLLKEVEGSDLFEVFRSMPRSEVFQRLKHIDFTVMCSVHDPLPTVCLESMSVGTPVIGNSRTGVREIFGDTNCGLLFEGDMEVTHVIKFITSLQKAGYQQLCVNCIDRINSSFSLSTQAEKVRALLSQSKSSGRSQR